MLPVSCNRCPRGRPTQRLFHLSDIFTKIVVFCTRQGRETPFTPAHLLWLIQRDFLEGKSVQQMVRPSKWTSFHSTNTSRVQLKPHYHRARLTRVHRTRSIIVPCVYGIQLFFQVISRQLCVLRHHSWQSILISFDTLFHMETVRII